MANTTSVPQVSPTSSRPGEAYTNPKYIDTSGQFDSLTKGVAATAKNFLGSLSAMEKAKTEETERINKLAAKKRKFYAEEKDKDFKRAQEFISTAKLDEKAAKEYREMLASDNDMKWDLFSENEDMTEADMTKLSKIKQKQYGFVSSYTNLRNISEQATKLGRDGSPGSIDITDPKNLQLIEILEIKNGTSTDVNAEDVQITQNDFGDRIMTYTKKDETTNESGVVDQKVHEVNLSQLDSEFSLVPDSSSISKDFLLDEKGKFDEQLIASGDITTGDVKFYENKIEGRIQNGAKQVLGFLNSQDNAARSVLVNQIAPRLSADSEQYANLGLINQALSFNDNEVPVKKISELNDRKVTENDVNRYNESIKGTDRSPISYKEDQTYGDLLAKVATAYVTLGSEGAKNHIKRKNAASAQIRQERKEREERYENRKAQRADGTTFNTQDFYDYKKEDIEGYEEEIGNLSVGGFKEYYGILSKGESARLYRIRAMQAGDGPKKYVVSNASKYGNRVQKEFGNEYTFDTPKAALEFLFKGTKEKEQDAADDYPDL